MVLVSDYFLAISFTVLAMICWGSWANTQKLAEKEWRFELFYWDLITGIFLMGLLSAFTVGSLGGHGRSFLEDLTQADFSSIGFASLGGALWNAGNMLLVAAIAVAGMSVAFPIGGGLAWILGIVLNYILIILDRGVYEGNILLLWPGVLVIIAAIFLSSRAYGQLASQRQEPTIKGILLSVSAGLLIAFFYPVTVKSIDNAFVAGGTGSLTPYSSIVFFSVGIVISTFILNPLFMKWPVQGGPVSIRQYWKGSLKTHAMGALGGAIWMLGMILSFMAVSAANPAISYALSNAAPVVAMIWGIFVWREFREAPRKTGYLIAFMFIFYLVGLVMITASSV